MCLPVKAALNEIFITSSSCFMPLRSAMYILKAKEVPHSETPFVLTVLKFY